MSVSDKAYRELAQMVVDLQKRFDGLSTSQLAHSSLENTGLATYDDAGQIVGQIGRLPDGSYGSVTLSGPPPPIPSAPKARAVRGVGLEIEWDGLFQDAQAVVPLEGGRLEVYVHESPDIAPVLVPTYTLESPRGGKFLISVGYDQTHYVAFAFRASSGKVSPASAVVGPYTVGRATAEDLDVDFGALAGTTVFYGPDEPVTDKADLWLRTDAGEDNYTSLRYRPADGEVAGAWVEMQDQGVVGALLVAEAAQAAADLKAQVFAQASPPTGLAPNDKAIWVDTDDSNVTYTWTGTAWLKRQLGNGAIVPNSLIAKDVIATGTVTAALFEALMILTTELIAGNPLGSHARMTPQGFRVYREDLNGDGAPDEVVRMGTDTNDYFGIVDANGNLVASVDDTGRGSFTQVDTPALNVGGKNILQVISDGPRGIIAQFNRDLSADLGPIFFPVGIAEVGATLVKGRAYRVSWRCLAWTENDLGQARFNVHVSSGTDGNTTTSAPAPTVNTAVWAKWDPFMGILTNKPDLMQGSAVYDATKTTQHRFGLSVGLGPDSALSNVWIAKRDIEIIIEDIGRSIPLSGSITQMGGALNNGQTAPPPPTTVTRQYFVDLAPAGRASWTGSGQLMTWAGNDVYQGYQSTNGNTRGQFWFDLPNITGTVDSAYFWAYSRHWYYNSGGTARMGITDQRGVFTDHSFRGLYETGGWPKPGGKEVIIPGDWLALFKGTNNNSFNGRGTCITLGPGNGTNPLYYGVFTDARLRIYFTQ